MKYDPMRKSFTITGDDLHNASNALISALRHIRETAGLPLDKYEREGLLTAADHAQKDLLDAAAILGIDFGVRWGNELDVRYR
jgi:hypothetical protein